MCRWFGSRELSATRKAYSPFGTGLRLLPVALSVATAAIVGTKLAVRFGNKAVVASGLGSIAVAFLWISTASAATAYIEIAAQMILLGLGLGLTSAPATEAIMDVIPKEKAGIGSAMNDATRELGGTLGVTVIGSVFASIYSARLALPAGLPAEAVRAARESVGGAFIAAQRVADAGLGPLADQLRATASGAFFDGFAIGCLVATGVAALGALTAAVFLPAQPIVAAPGEGPVAEAPATLAGVGTAEAPGTLAGPAPSRRPARSPGSAPSSGS
jgi:hypothetical protein